jgi:hypothetical protein
MYRFVTLNVPGGSFHSPVVKTLLDGIGGVSHSGRVSPKVNRVVDKTIGGVKVISLDFHRDGDVPTSVKVVQTWICVKEQVAVGVGIDR